MGSPRPGHVTILNFLKSETLIASLGDWYRLVEQFGKLLVGYCADVGHGDDHFML